MVEPAGGGDFMKCAQSCPLAGLPAPGQYFPAFFGKRPLVGIADGTALEGEDYVGASGSHLKMKVAHDGAIMDAIAFRQGNKIGSTRRRIDIVYNIGIDNWGYRPKLQMTVLDFHESG